MTTAWMCLNCGTMNDTIGTGSKQLSHKMIELYIEYEAKDQRMPEFCDRCRENRP